MGYRARRTSRVSKVDVAGDAFTRVDEVKRASKVEKCMFELRQPSV
jgi:hypothetical protein